jgi:hypothetical protein
MKIIKLALVVLIAIIITPIFGLIGFVEYVNVLWMNIIKSILKEKK